jgi:predicted nucleotidyltransferase
MPTALELSREEWQPYIEAMRQRPSESVISPQKEQLREALLEKVRRVAVELKNRFGVKQVILFGSLTDATQFVSDSDVDLAVAGLNAAEYFRAWRLVEDMIQDRVVDLVEIEQVTNSLRESIFKYGIEL